MGNHPSTRRDGIGLCLLVLFLLFSLASHAQWMAPRVPDSLSHVWFRQAFTTDGRPRKAYVNVASTGSFKLYVNQMAVGHAAYFAPREAGDSTPVSVTIDVTPYLRSDTNVVAVLYSPSFPHASQRQVSIIYYGVDGHGRRFSHADDSGWLCRTANSRLTGEGGELVDNRRHNPNWNAATLRGIALWAPANVVESHPATFFPSTTCPAMAFSHRETQLYNEQRADTLTFNLGQRHRFQPRLTLREARRGEVIHVGRKLRYICNGKIDEQAFPVFACENADELIVTGDSRFNVRQITTLDLLFLDTVLSVVSQPSF